MKYGRGVDIAVCMCGTRVDRHVNSNAFFLFLPFKILGGLMEGFQW
jgi:hypothetical protein